MTDAQGNAEQESPAGQTAGPETEAPGAPEAAAEEGAAAAGTSVDPAELERLRAENAELKDRYLRSLAEMENVRRRARLDVEEATKFANERLISDLLPVLDNFYRALEASEQTPNFEALKTGVDLIHRQLSEVLGRAGLEKIEAVGQPFDPNLHEAIMQVEPQDGQKPHHVVEELRAGYRISDRVVRPTLVKVTSG